VHRQVARSFVLQSAGDPGCAAGRAWKGNRGRQMVFAVEGHVPHQPAQRRQVWWCGCFAAPIGVVQQHRAQRHNEALARVAPGQRQQPEPESSRPLPASSERKQGRGVDRRLLPVGGRAQPPPASAGDVGQFRRRRPPSPRQWERVWPIHPGSPLSSSAIRPAESWGCPLELRIQPGLVGV